MNNNAPQILVIGAGASGLAFALACAAQGCKVRIIERRASRVLLGKATGVAQGVWQQLARFGIAIPTEASPMANFVFYDDERQVANVAVPTVNQQPPAHLYPQAELELKLEQTLAGYGVQVEYGCSLQSLQQEGDRVQIQLQHGANICSESVSADWLIAADGAHSSVRTMMQLPFDGIDYPEQWSVAEINTQLWLPDAQARLHLQSNGEGLFLSQPAPGIVQGILNAPGAAEKLQQKFNDAELRYQRNFSVALRRVSTPRHGRVWLIGDAAHIQSPVGGQGLNLAIWDGITLAYALLKGDLSVEKQLIKRSRSVLRFTHFDYQMLSTQRTWLRYLRNQYWQFAAQHPIVARWFFKMISGVW